MDESSRDGLKDALKPDLGFERRKSRLFGAELKIGNITTQKAP